MTLVRHRDTRLSTRWWCRLPLRLLTFCLATNCITKGELTKFIRMGANLVISLQSLTGSGKASQSDAKDSALRKAGSQVPAVDRPGALEV